MIKAGAVLRGAYLIYIYIQYTFYIYIFTHPALNDQICFIDAKLFL